MASSLNSFTTCKVVIKVKIFQYSKRVATLPGEIFAIFLLAVVFLSLYVNKEAVKVTTL